MSDGATPTRRRVLASGLAGTLLLAGCLGEDGDDADEDAPPSFPAVEDPPEAVYRPTHREAVRALDPVRAGPYAVEPMVTYPHRFWTVTGRDAERVDPAAGDDVHLMATVRDAETGTVVPLGAGVEFSVSRASEGDDEGETVAERRPWPMLSQGMGFHVGDNVALDGDGTYRVEGSIDPLDATLTGAFADRLGGAADVAFSFTFDDDLRRLAAEVDYLPESEWGERGALDPMQSADGDAPAALPPAEDLPGALQGTPETGDAVLATTLLEPGSRVADGWYLAVSARTPYNRFPLPAATLEATLAGGEPIGLSAALDPELGFHYGAGVDAPADGDALAIETRAPPQVSRHQGYETAFLEMPPVTTTITL
ncbi:iron transporter [Salinilacihabitans rarus]|uniref:iron transporter n=1 Tax=Salinilacihabitans rarus TaxID=2961596 RepID=UPI0020C8CC12|nr:iron transporter [Salinilacihabitans rarus]